MQHDNAIYHSYIFLRIDILVETEEYVSKRPCIVRSRAELENAAAEVRGNADGFLHKYVYVLGPLSCPGWALDIVGFSSRYRTAQWSIEVNVNRQESDSREYIESRRGRFIHHALPLQTPAHQPYAPSLSSFISLISLYSSIAPEHETLYTYHFSSPTTSPTHLYPPEKQGGYTNPLTHERLNWSQVKSHATYISTALVKDYGLKENDTIAVVGGGSVWYPVGVWGGVRVGMY